MRQFVVPAVVVAPEQHVRVVAEAPQRAQLLGTHQVVQKAALAKELQEARAVKIVLKGGLEDAAHAHHVVVQRLGDRGDVAHGGWWDALAQQVHHVVCSVAETLQHGRCVLRE